MLYWSDPNSPSQFTQVIFVLLGIGLFISLVVAWAFELTPEGIKKEKDVDRTQSITPQTGRRLNLIIIALLVPGMACFFWESRFSGRDAGTDAAPAMAESAPQPAAEAEPPQPETSVNRQSIAVLPFNNRSRNEDDEYFTEGIRDDMAQQLEQVRNRGLDQGICST